MSACGVGFKLLVNPKRPVDGGTFKTLTVKAPEGSIFHAHEPAACQWYFTPLGLLIDLIPKALAEALPDAVAGAITEIQWSSMWRGRIPGAAMLPFYPWNRRREDGALSRQAMDRTD
ncbi:MAG TPA: hydantoinase B/oxoprolinase family protein [Candidatus Dormibacteraeota bacterium]|nr:hydantoinase B/oxoprolinase family protein [Candidatus Dormibacteraeota bacterium]